MNVVLVQKLPIVISDADSLGRVTADPLLADAAGGVPWLIDMGFNGSYSGASPVPNGAAVANIVAGQPGSTVVVPGTSPTIAGRGLDWGGANTAGTHVTIPTSVAAAISAASQDFMFCMYFKLPSAANWLISNGQGNPLMNFCASGNWANQPDILTIGALAAGGTVPSLTWRKQTAVGAASAMTIQLTGGTAAHLGQVVQLAYWRSGTNETATIKSASLRSTATATGSADNTETITGLEGKIGMLQFWGAFSTEETNFKNNSRFYRGFVEIPSISGRDPLNVLDADWARNVARFS